MKRCPVCRESLLHEVTIEDGLLAFRCSGCQGIWISSEPYQNWWRAHRPELPEKEASECQPPVSDTEQIKSCPDCGHLMARLRVASDLEFSVDHCGQCNGVWLDRGEWEALVARNLHDKINSFCTEPWQTRLRAEETRYALDRLYLAKFGADDYARLQEMRRWLATHPLRSMILAYLGAEDPYER
jgi:Zn-finger nucleic acid-binding protein